MGSMSGETSCEFCDYPKALHILSNSLDEQQIKCPQCKKTYTYIKVWVLHKEEPYNATSR